MTSADKEKRVIMCNWFVDKIEEEPDFPSAYRIPDDSHVIW
jgi:hypothetical protein